VVPAPAVPLAAAGAAALVALPARAAQVQARALAVPLGAAEPVRAGRRRVRP
jgi:hypothetical protein